MCREAGARVTPNAFVRDLDVGAFNGLDGRRTEVIADGLTLWQRAQLLAIDTTLVASPAGWESEEERRKARRRGHIPRVGGRGWTSPFGGLGC